MKTMLILTAVFAAGILMTNGCSSTSCCKNEGACTKPAMKCDGGCCKDAAACAKCCADAAGCAKCCKK